jgi:starch synthase (maltosyl-transferring)
MRREHRALQLYDNLSFHMSENPQVLFYRKAAWVRPREWTGGRASYYRVPDKLLARDNDADVLVAVTLEPHRVQETMVHVPLADLGIREDEAYVVHDLLTDTRYTWRGVRNYVRLDPNGGQVGHVFRVERWGPKG